jgi:isoquinoline 1-oxidoreductase
MTIELQKSVSRRNVLKGIAGATGLVVTWSSLPSIGAPGAAAQQAAPQFPSRTAPTDVDSYLSVNSDGTIRLATGKVEFGQGIQTGFMQIAAEELNVPFESIQIVMGKTDVVPYDGSTAGSGSTRRTGIVIRQAAAEMREWLKELGATELEVTPADVFAKDGSITLTSDPTKTVTYANLATAKRVVRTVSENSPLKDPSEYTIVGQEIPRVDVPAKVTGEMKYGYDVTVDGFVHGKIVRPPFPSATLIDIDFSAAEAMPGVVGTFRDGDFAGLAAERRDQAEAALAAVKATWSENTTGNTSDNIFELIYKTADEGVVQEEEPGDPDPIIASAETTYEATYLAPYVSHSPLEPKTATVEITPERVNVWTSTQAPFSMQQAVAGVVGRPLEEVVVETMMSGGAFGSKVWPIVEVEAARLALGIGKPIRLQWTRQEEFQFGQFRPASRGDITAALDADGTLTAWKYDLYTSGYYPEGAETPTVAAANAGMNINDVYAGPETKSTWYQGHSPLRPYFWRGNGTSYTDWAIESSLDELAELAGVDPVSFRRPLLAENPRMEAVMDAVVDLAKWTPGVGSTGAGVGMALGFADGTWVGEVAKVAVDETSGLITVTDFWVVVDCGLVINPMNVRQQLEGSVIFALSPTLKEAITFENGKVTNASWGMYRPITIKDVPNIEVGFVEDKTQPMQGIGEPAVAPVAAAVANAVYDAVGVRLREMPFTSSRVLEAIEAKK